MANSLTAPGNVQTTVPPDVLKALCDIFCECNNKPSPMGATCTRLGTSKHDCCENAIKNEHQPPPALGGEQGYKADGTKINAPRVPPHCEPGSVWPDACSLDSGGNPDQFFDFKFACPQGSPIRQHTYKKLEAQGIPGPHVTLIKSTPPSPPDWSRGQKPKVEKLGAKLNPPVTKEPALINAETCNC